MLTTTFDETFAYAHHLHRKQTRKGSGSPYIAHLMGVASLVIEHGGNETQAIGALLHDAVEDQGGPATLSAIRERFGGPVAAIVADCTDAWADPKPAWRPRKEAYLAELPGKPASSLLVSLADKVYNAEAIANDYHALGDEVWSRFTGGAEGTRWYYGEMVRIFAEVRPGALADRLARAGAGQAAPTMWTPNP